MGGAEEWTKPGIFYQGVLDICDLVPRPITDHGIHAQTRCDVKGVGGQIVNKRRDLPVDPVVAE